MDARPANRTMTEPERESQAAPAPRTATIPTLVAALSSSDELEREAARAALVAIGAEASDWLLEVARGGDTTARAEAIHGLGATGFPAAAPALLATLLDEDSNCRWQAAEALGSLEREGLQAVLRRLVEEAVDPLFLRGAHHALHALIARGFAETVRPVLDAWRGPVPEYAIPQAAHAALDALRAGA